MSDNDDRPSPGTVGPAHLKKAACGIRYDEDELRQGIDFSGAVDLRAEAQDNTATQRSEPDEQTGP